MNLPIGLWRWELSWSFIAASPPRCLTLTLQDTKRRISCGRWSFQWADRAHTGIALRLWCWWVVEKYFQIASNLSKHVMFLIWVFDMFLICCFSMFFPGVEGLWYPATWCLHYSNVSQVWSPTAGPTTLPIWWRLLWRMRWNCLAMNPF